MKSRPGLASDAPEQVPDIDGPLGVDQEDPTGEHMGTPIWRATSGVLGLAGGAPHALAALSQAALHVGDWVAADGGADLLLKAGITPRLVVGDFDSISDAARNAFAGQLHRIPEQDTTDFDKALRSADAPFLIAVGFTGGRFDHGLAVMNTLVRYPHRRCIVLGDDALAFHCPPRLELRLPRGALVSLFPMRSLFIDSTGLRWPTEGLKMAPAGRIGTSNEVAEDLVTLSPRTEGCLVILRAEALGPAVSALSAAQTWPAPD